MVYQDQIELTTAGHRDMHDVTGQLRGIVRDANISTGLANIHVIGSTGAVGTIEFEPGLARDLPELLDKLIPPSSQYGHELAWQDGNGHSHLQASIVGPSLSIPVGDGQPILGTWQQVFFLECDVRARTRSLVVTVVGD